ncbi:MAG: protein kinase, partial [Anaerolineae bacterium]|nr:protein kinase [Anaerolineae bacterium]
MHDLIGKQVGEYLIEENVGSGSTGQTFRARDDKTQQAVALKLVHAHLASQPTFQEKWLGNATAIPALQHQAIAHVYRVGQTDGQLFAAAEWVRGETLGHVLHSGQPLALRMAGRLVQLAGDALVYAHRQGVIHGGLQPFNVLLAPHGGELPWRPLLTDFRQASLISGEPSPTLLPYLSPEQCDGKRPNGRSDVYALGILLYQLCTGQLPFQPTSTRDVLAGGTPPPPRSLRPEMPTVLEAIILKAMARNTAERYRSMEEFLLFLRREVDKLPSDGAGLADVAVPPPAQAAAVRPSPAAPPAPVPAAPVAAVVIAAPASSSDTDYLIIRHERLEPQTFLLHKWLITIGIQRDNDLVLTGEGVAAKHARLERTDTGWNVIDMGSLNGTFLEGSQLLADMPEPWKPGQMVRLGEYTLEWKSGL